MTTETHAYLERFEYLHSEVKKAIHDMGKEELEWKPLPSDTSSPCVLATHIVGVEAFNIHQLVGGIDVHRNRDAEFAAKGASAKELEALLDKTAAITRTVLMKASSNDLAKSVQPRPDQAPVNLRLAILRSLDHIGQHLGHLSLTKQLYHARKG